MTTTRGRILVVDDDRLVLATVVHGLAQAGYEVIDADNGDDAILLAREHRPELALLDIRMEGKTGFDVAEYLRDVAHVPFMFLSAFADAPTRAKVDELGALAYLVKPLDVGKIVPTVDEVFERLRRGASRRDRPPAQASAEAPVEVAAASAAPSLPTGQAEVVLVAVGILMNRFSLTRAQGVARLQRMAADKGVATEVQATRLVEAVEDLASPDGH